MRRQVNPRRRPWRRLRTCFGIAMPMSIPEEFPKKRKRMSTIGTPVGKKCAKIEPDWAAVQAVMSYLQGKAFLKQVVASTAQATSQVQPPADATGKNDD